MFRAYPRMATGNRVVRKCVELFVQTADQETQIELLQHVMEGLHVRQDYLLPGYLVREGFVKVLISRVHDTTLDIGYRRRCLKCIWLTVTQIGGYDGFDEFAMTGAVKLFVDLLPTKDRAPSDLLLDSDEGVRMSDAYDAIGLLSDDSVQLRDLCIFCGILDCLRFALLDLTRTEIPLGTRMKGVYFAMVGCFRSDECPFELRQLFMELVYRSIPSPSAEEVTEALHVLLDFASHDDEHFCGFVPDFFLIEEALKAHAPHDDDGEMHFVVLLIIENMIRSRNADDFLDRYPSAIRVIIRCMRSEWPDPRDFSANLLLLFGVRLMDYAVAVAESWRFEVLPILPDPVEHQDSAVAAANAKLLARITKVLTHQQILRHLVSKPGFFSSLCDVVKGDFDDFEKDSELLYHVVNVVKHLLFKERAGGGNECFLAFSQEGMADACDRLR